MSPAPLVPVDSFLILTSIHESVGTKGRPMESSGIAAMDVPNNRVNSSHEHIEHIDRGVCVCPISSTSSKVGCFTTGLGGLERGQVVEAPR